MRIILPKDFICLISWLRIGVGPSGVFDRILIAEVLPNWERGRLACNVFSLRTIASRLAADNYDLVPTQTPEEPEEQRSWSAPTRFNQRCTARRADPLQEVVARVQKLKVAGNDLYVSLTLSRYSHPGTTSASSARPWCCTIMPPLNCTLGSRPRSFSPRLLSSRADLPSCTS